MWCNDVPCVSDMCVMCVSVVWCVLGVGVCVCVCVVVCVRVVDAAKRFCETHCIGHSNAGLVRISRSPFSALKSLSMAVSNIKVNQRDPSSRLFPSSRSSRIE